MMHYGFCRKHADQTGEGGCPECAMDHQQSTILAMTETAKEASRVHIDMHNQIVALQSEVARLRAIHNTYYNKPFADAVSEAARTATEAALRWAANDIQSHDHPVLIWDAWIRSGRKALLGEDE